MVRTVVALFLGIALSSLMGWDVVHAAPTPEQRRQVSQIDAALTKAGNLFRDKKYKESAEVVKEAQSQLEKLAEQGHKDLLPLLEDSFKRLSRAHGLLDIEGFSLPELKKPSDLMPAPMETPSKPAGGTPGVKVPTGAVSFVNHTAPILMSKCGRCHVNDAKGMFSMSDYATLMKGPKEGKVIFPGDPSGSRLIEVIESGDMPRGGLKVTADELTILKKWITEGAKFDGTSDKDNLRTLVPDVRPADAPQVQITAPTGKETVSFANEVANLLATNCNNCHGTMRPRENFSLATFQSLIRGGDGGPPIIPGKPEESLLIKKLKGTASGARMPQGRPPLDDADIAKIETWIKEGAKFDSRDPSQPLRIVAAVAKAIRSTHDQLSADRVEIANENWSLAVPGSTPAKHESKNFLVYGNVGPNTLTDVGEAAEAVAPRVAQVFKANPDEPLLKGRMTLFVFGQRYEYNEFGQMVEKRELPKDWKGHWAFNIVDAYAAIIAPRNGEDTLDALVAQQLGGTYIASLGNVPRWFAEGCGRVAASKVAPGDKRVQTWYDMLPEVQANSKKADDFQRGALPSELSDVGSFGFVSFLMTDSKRFDKLLDLIRKEAPFDQAVSSVYGATPAQLADNWIKRPITKPKVGRSTTKKS